MLNAISRQPKIKLNQYRKEGKIPAVIYGKGFGSTPVLIDRLDLIESIKEFGEGTLWDISVDGGEKFKVILQDYQIDPIKRNFIHIDLYRINIKEKLKTEINLVFVGESKAVKAGGVLIKNKDYVEVECLPKDLVSEIEVDLSPLVEMRSSIKVSDIKAPEGIEILDDGDVIIASVSEVKEEEEITAEEEQEAIEELGKEGKEEDEGKKGEGALEEGQSSKEEGEGNN